MEPSRVNGFAQVQKSGADCVTRVKPIQKILKKLFEPEVSIYYIAFRPIPAKSKFIKVRLS